MDARVDIAVDRESEVIVSSFVKPLDARLRERGVGSVVRYSSNELWVHVDLILSAAADMDHVLQFLAEADAPTGSLVYRLDESGGKQDIFVLGPP
jgi:hypothetical protein